MGACVKVGVITGLEAVAGLSVVLITVLPTNINEKRDTYHSAVLWGKMTDELKSVSCLFSHALT